ncbi:MAG: SH3 domain-containing protein, partial [Terriglobales bacterium]
MKQNALLAKSGPPNFIVRQLNASAAGLSTGGGRHHRSASGGQVITYYLSGKPGDYEIDVHNTGSMYTFAAGKKLNEQEIKIAQEQLKPTGVCAPAAVASTKSVTEDGGLDALASQAGTTASNTTPAKIVVKEAGEPTTPSIPGTVIEASKKDKSAAPVVAAQSEPTPDAAATAGASKESSSARDLKDLKDVKDLATQTVNALTDSKSSRTKKKEAIQKTKQEIFSKIASRLGTSSSPLAEDTEPGTASTKNVSSSTANKSEPTPSSKKSEPVTASAKSSSAPEYLNIPSGDKIKVRTGPATDFRQIAEASGGSKFQILGKENGWYKVKCGQKEGYIYGGLVETKKSDAYMTASVKHVQAVTDGK